MEVGNTEFELSTNYHSKRGYDVYTASPQDRFDSETFRDLSSKAKRLGGWYYKPYKGTPGGFHFENEESREKFLGLTEGENADVSARLEEDKRLKSASAAERMNAMADRLHESANADLSADRRTNTSRQAEMAAGIQGRARSNIARAATMRNIASAIDSGQAKYLDGISAGTHIEALESVLNRSRWNKLDHLVETEYGGDRRKLPNQTYENAQQEPITAGHADHASYPYPVLQSSDINRMSEALRGRQGIKYERDYLKKLSEKAGDRGIVRLKSQYQWEALKSVTAKLRKVNPREHKWTIESLKSAAEPMQRLHAAGITNEHELRAALREYIPIRGKKGAEDPIAKAERDLIGRKIPGFFPTPPGLIDQMLSEADIRSGHDVLEPSSGKGDILDAVRDEHPDANLKGMEFNRELSPVLSAKGHDVEYGDFLAHQGQYDRIVMNPPFEKGADISHVQHAYKQLKPGGRLVAIMSGGGGGNREQFDEWVSGLGGSSEELPQGSFNLPESFRKTGVNVKMVSVDKPQAESYSRNREAVTRYCRTHYQVSG